MPPMTPDQIAADTRVWREAQSASVLSVEAAMSEPDKARLLTLTAAPGSSLHGAAVADVLDIYSDHDMHLDWTEPFCEGGGLDTVYAVIGYDPESTTGASGGYLRAMTASRALMACAVLAQGVPTVEAVRDLTVAALAAGG